MSNQDKKKLEVVEGKSQNDKKYTFGCNDKKVLFKCRRWQKCTLQQQNYKKVVLWAAMTKKVLLKKHKNTKCTLKQQQNYKKVVFPSNSPHSLFILILTLNFNFISFYSSLQTNVPALVVFKWKRRKFSGEGCFLFGFRRNTCAILHSSLRKCAPTVLSFLR